MEFMPTSRMQVFANLIHDQLGVDVRLRGNTICVAYPKRGKGKPVIYLPNLEYGKESDTRILFGFGLHEAGHIRYTDSKLLRDLPDQLTRWAENAFEDIFIEGRLRRDFPGGKEMLRYSHDAGYETYVKGGEKRETLFSKEDVPFLDNPSHVDEVTAKIGKAAILRRMSALGLDTSDDSIRREMTKRLEIDRFLGLYLYDWREGKDAVIRKRYAEHPWKPVLDEINKEKSKSTADCLDKAKRLIATLDAKPVLPGDYRPITESDAAESEARTKRVAALEAAHAIRRAKRECNRKIRERLAASPEYQALLEARDDLTEAKTVAEGTGRRSEKARNRVDGLKKAIAKADERIPALKRRLEELKGRLVTTTTDAERMEIEKAIASLAERLDRAEMAQERRKQALPDAERELSEATAADNAARDVLEGAKEKEAAAKQAYDAAASAIRSEVKAEYQPILAELEAAEKAKATELVTAEATASEAARALKAGDDISDALIAAGITEEVVRAVIEKIRSTSTVEELSDLGIGGDADDGEPIFGKIPGGVPPKPTAALGARAYMPYDRSRDVVLPIAETPEARNAYEAARKEYAAVIAETTERLKKLYSPIKNRLKMNADTGRLDSRKAHKLGLALKGVPVDLSRVWKSVETRADRKVACSLLIDCSGSMSGTKIDLARKAACCLSEVMSALQIPHEILGHTAGVLGGGDFELPPDVDPGEYSRVLPAVLYEYKKFQDKAAPASVFSEVELLDNLDSEALSASLGRLAARPERTRMLLVLSDGAPMCSLSSVDELERALYTTCKAAEHHEREGLFVVGIGIQSPRVREFYRNAEVLNVIDELPQAVLGIVERILGKVGMG